MRILVIQLARFGDIFQTLPTLNALKRLQPSAEIHFLVRSRFIEATSGLNPDVAGAGNKIHLHEWPTHEILAPILTSADELGAHAQLLAKIQPLIDLKFDQIINLSFSPFSSYLTELLGADTAEVRGYTRQADGYLNTPDDTSAYFYAQVGIGRANRYHVTDLFAAVAGVDLINQDHKPSIDSKNTDAQVSFAQRRGVIVHLGASTADKTYPPDLWVTAIEHLLKHCPDEITLVGSLSERALAETVTTQLANAQIKNQVGRSSLSELMNWIAHAKLLIGADSAPVHMAALCNTPVLNLSSSRVNFWETGPRSAGSRILFSNELQTLDPNRVGREASAMLRGEGPTGPCIVRDSILQPYRSFEIETEDFSWQLIEALYTGTDFPKAECNEDRLAFQRLFELSELALQQLDRWDDSKCRTTAAQILAHIDEILPEISKLNPRIDPVIQWFETQRLRIPGGNGSETLQRTRKTFEELHLVTSVYREFLDPAQELKQAMRLCQECAPELREYGFARVQSSVQALVSKLQELARHSSSVGGKSWSSILHEFDRALALSDFVALADLLEWNLIPAMAAQLVDISTPTLLEKSEL